MTLFTILDPLKQEVLNDPMVLCKEDQQQQQQMELLEQSRQQQEQLRQESRMDQSRNINLAMNRNHAEMGRSHGLEMNRNTGLELDRMELTRNYVIGINSRNQEVERLMPDLSRGSQGLELRMNHGLELTRNQGLELSMNTEIGRNQDLELIRNQGLELGRNQGLEQSRNQGLELRNQGLELRNQELELSRNPGMERLNLVELDRSGLPRISQFSHQRPVSSSQVNYVLNLSC